MSDLHNFSILMLIFSGAILLYALILAWTKDVGLIRRSYAVKMKNKKLYAVQFAKVLAIISIAPLLTGLAGLVIENGFVLAAVLIVSFVICARIGIKLMKDVVI